MSKSGPAPGELQPEILRAFWPVLGLIFLRFSGVRFDKRWAELKRSGGASSCRGSRLEAPTAYHAEGVLYLEPKPRFDHLLILPEGAAVGQAVSGATRATERDTPQFGGVQPKSYEGFSGTLLKELLKKVPEIPAGLDYDAFGHITSTSWGPWRSPRGAAAASSSSPRASSASSWRSSSPSMGTSSTRPAVRAACSWRARVSWPSIIKNPLPSWPSAGRRRRAPQWTFAGGTWPCTAWRGASCRPSPATRTCTPPRAAPTGRRLKSKP